MKLTFWPDSNPGIAAVMRGAAACLIGAALVMGPLRPSLHAQGAATPTPMDDAFAAIAELKTAAEIGVLRAQWAERLLAAVPRIRAFTESTPSEWPDVKAALEMAVDEYRGALNNWQAARIYFEDGTRAAGYAKDLASKPEEKDHREVPTPGAQLAFGTPVFGRLGFGDATLPDGRYEETFTLPVARKSNLRFALDCLPVSGGCRPIVSGPDGKQIDVIRDYSDQSAPGFKTTKESTPGVYRVQVAGAVGLFKLTVSPVK